MKKHILLLDTNKENLTLFMKALDEMSVAVKCTYTDSHTHAAQMLEYLLPDGIFVHLDPDITDNLEFVRLVKKKKTLHNIPVTVYADQMPYYNFLARGHGADQCIVSPLNLETIKQALETIIHRDPTVA
ncbi:MAG: hypothetical protein J7497_05715 [Chitinophagaceae bacterium]|nr:hypothetical protein [Chitinophagaceae bacterium]